MAQLQLQQLLRAIPVAKHVQMLKKTQNVILVSQAQVKARTQGQTLLKNCVPLMCVQKIFIKTPLTILVRPAARPAVKHAPILATLNALLLWMDIG